jgi:DNA-binding transcriptional LysR family regulator
MPFSLVELHVLTALAQDKTLAAIGEELCLGQPAVSKILHSAEQKAGLQLVERRGRRVYLTSTGAEIARAAQPIAVQLDDLQQVLQRVRAGKGGELRLVATPIAANYLLPEVLGEFLRECPDVQPVVRVVATEDIWDVLLNERYDLGIGHHYVQPSGLSIEKLSNEPIVFFVAPHSPLAQRPAVRWSDLQRQPLLAPFSEPHWAQLFQELDRRGLTLGPHIDLRAYEGAKRLVEMGYGVGVNFAAALAREFADGRLCPLVVEDLVLSWPYCLIQRQHVELSPVARQFRALLTARHRANHSRME